MIRQSANELSPSGRPDTVFFIPEVFNSTSYLQEVDPLDLAVAKDVCCEIPQDASFETFSELAQMIMSENNIESPGIDIDKIERLYIDLLEHIQAIV